MWKMNQIVDEEKSVDILDLLQEHKEIKEIAKFLLLSDDRDQELRQEYITKSFGIIGGQYNLPNTVFEFLETDCDYIIHGLLKHLKAQNSLESIYGVEIVTDVKTPKYIEFLRTQAEEKSFFDAYLYDTTGLENVDGFNLSFYDKELGHEVPYDKNNPKHNQNRSPRNRRYEEYSKKHPKFEQSSHDVSINNSTDKTENKRNHSIKEFSDKLKELDIPNYTFVNGINLDDSTLYFRENHQDITFCQWVINGIKNVAKFVQSL